MPLPPGYYLDRTDPEVLTLRRAEGAVVARFSTSGYVAEAVERQAWEDHRQRNRRPPPLSREKPHKRACTARVGSWRAQPPP
jgi:hypothetical protein